MITIHGTNDSELSPSKWWSPDSRFGQALTERLDGATVVPFRWSGNNSEVERRSAARSLYKIVRNEERLNNDYIILGHSHGGSVALEMLRRACLGRNLNYLKSVVTVGTPYIDFHTKNRVFPHLSLFSLISLLIIQSILVSLYIMPNGFPTFYKSLVRAATNDASIFVHLYVNFAIFLSVLGTLYLIYKFSSLLPDYVSRRNDTKNRQRLNDLYSDRLLTINHENDEAIASLSLLGEVKFPLPKQRLSLLRISFWSIFVWLFLAPIALPQSEVFIMEHHPGVHSVILNFANSWMDIVEYFSDVLKGWFFEDAASFLKEKRSQFGNSGNTIGRYFADTSLKLWVFIYLVVNIPVIIILMLQIFSLISIPFLGIIFCVIFLLQSQISPLVGQRLRSNGNTLIRNLASGNDTRYEVSSEVSVFPRGMRAETITFPTDVSEELLEEADAATFKRLKSARRSIHLLSNKGGLPTDLYRGLISELDWTELIHTTYFKNENAKQFIIEQLVQRYNLQQ